MKLLLPQADPSHAELLRFELESCGLARRPPEQVGMGRERQGGRREPSRGR